MRRASNGQGTTGGPSWTLATAAELALYYLLMGKEKASEDRETLGWLVREWNKKRPELAVPNARPGLVDVRNEAAHQGVTPSVQQAQKALTLSGTFVDRAWPRASLLTATW